ncbi:disease resistance-like protein DSC1 [Pistacia vera]|uniref:disease resistance-like protein DSC1 n=1 Tax=Pistacia vera TaxID=55513 RepID=UPI001263BB3C|nr:disease resistance-like protein DSC1 [Pistacia vera]
MARTRLKHLVSDRLPEDRRHSTMENNETKIERSSYLSEYENSFRFEYWKNAGLKGKGSRPESKLIEKIIEHTLKRLNDMSSIYSKNLIGIAMKIQKIKSLLSNGPKKVCKVGIWGMGGIGKTTLADVVFNDISSQFEASYFTKNVREVSEKGELSHSQKEPFSTILEDEHINIRLTFTKERLGCKSVLIVFDDVTDLKQIKELIGDLEYVSVGSQIIITTRDNQVLKNCGLDDSAIYEVKGLCSYESLQLFKQRAFKQNHPIDAVYMKLSNRVIDYIKGLPLALEVLGCFLLGRDKFVWESALDELKKSPNDVIQTVLKISYDGLDCREKDLFLDITYFFKGWNKHLVGRLSSHIGISVLIDKALITISYKTVTMHDLIQEMGWEIVRQDPVNKFCQRSRFWHCNDVYRVLKRNLGTDTIRGICFDMFQMREIHLDPYAFSKMRNLRFLIVNNSDQIDYNKVHGFEGIEFDFTELICLYWKGYPCTLLPLNFDPENLVELKMHGSNLKQLWTGIKDLANLKYFDLRYSKHLLKVPDLSQAQNLECLILEGCTSLFEITPPSQNLNKLIVLNLRYCENLISLPIGIQSKSLRDVILSGCSNLNTAPRISCNMKRLCLDGTAIKELSSSIKVPRDSSIESSGLFRA